MLSASDRSAEMLERELRDLVASVSEAHLAQLLARVFAPTGSTWQAFRDAPAAKHYHHAYPHGLLEHTLTVAQAVNALSAIFPGVDRDLALTGALIHDIGKLETYMQINGQTEMTDVGRLHGEIALGYARIRSELEQLDDCPDALAHALLHIVLSHHGALEHGSPVVPCTREATLVHMADNLGSKLGSFDRIERDLDDGAQWSRFDRGLGTSAYFGQQGAEPPHAALAA